MAAVLNAEIPAPSLDINLEKERSNMKIKTNVKAGIGGGVGDKPHES